MCCDEVVYQWYRVIESRVIKKSFLRKFLLSMAHVCVKVDRGKVLQVEV